MLSVDRRQGDERSPVLGPGGERRQPAEIGAVADHLAYRPRAAALEADTQQIESDVAGLPQLAGRRRQQLGRQGGDPPDPLGRLTAEGQARAIGGAEEIADQREVRPLDSGKEQRRAAGGDHPPVNLGDLLLGADRGVNGDQLAIAAQLVDETAEISETHGQLV